MPEAPNYANLHSLLFLVTAIQWHGALLSIDACPESSITQYFKFSRAFLEVGVHRQAHSLFTPANK